MFKIALIFGGPSNERGISLNSARSVVDHLSSPSIELLPLFVDRNKNFYLIPKAQLYSNTPADFDFKLDERERLDAPSLKMLFHSVHLVFPIIHGVYGEDGELQAFLEGIEVPFIGTGSQACRQLFCKYTASEVLRKAGYPTLPSLCLTSGTLAPIADFFETHQVKQAVVKPTIGGSSIGVSLVNTPAEALQKSNELWEKNPRQKVMIEPYCVGREFTVVVFEGPNQLPVALFPTEIELEGEQPAIFDYRKKYLPTQQTTYHTPARFTEDEIQSIQITAEKLFSLFKMRDFARLDGWFMEDGTLYFTDFNPLSGLEQNSFLFRQASLLGLSHQQALQLIVASACRREGLEISFEDSLENAHRMQVHVLFGGKSAERQVSLMSGTNVWLKLMHSSAYAPIPFLWDKEGAVWQLSYPYALDHTVEEIFERCNKTMLPSLAASLQKKLEIPQKMLALPVKMTMEEFLHLSKAQEAFIFLALHGGEGENGTLQEKLESLDIPFNGSMKEASSLCMDKYLTGEAVNALADGDLYSLPKELIPRSILATANWQKLTERLQSQKLLIKPRADGCSAGIVILSSEHDLIKYAFYLNGDVIPKNTFWNQKEMVELAAHANEFIIEPYIETDLILSGREGISHVLKEGWIELTVGVIEKNGDYHALTPSITLAEGAILSLEEKFQGGTGVNLTPPPSSIINDEKVKKIKLLVEKAAAALAIENYARLDVFFNVLTQKMILIEANTLPALTPSTVLYHQALAENPPLVPLDFLEQMITNRRTSCLQLA